MSNPTSSDSIERAKKALEDLESRHAEEFEGLMDQLEKALVKQYWEHMTRYVR